MKRITDHFLVLFRGGSLFGYSARSRGSSNRLRERFGAAPGQRILVAAMSSYDELFAAEIAGARRSLPLLFPSQADWIRSLVQFVRERKDLLLVIRVHPREFPNKREGVKSEHAAHLESLLTDLPPNVRVNWPADQISVYDLANEASAFLTAWSSVGKEMATLGLPVVTYCPQLLLYPAALHEAAVTLPDYHAAIERTLTSGWSLERVRKAYRWLALEHRHGAIDIADGFKYRENSFIERVWRRLSRTIHPALESRLEDAARWLDCVRRTRPLAQGDAIARLVSSGGRTPLDLGGPPGDQPSREEETRSLKRELGRIRAALFGNAPSPSPQSLCARLDEAVSADR
jgi:hypothetical protein